MTVDTTGRGLADTELLASVKRMIGRTQTGGGAKVADMHGVVQEFGQQGIPLAPGSMVIMPITKRCQISGWTLDSLTIGTAQISIQYSPLTIPRTFNDMIGDSTLWPTLNNISNNFSENLSLWVGPLQLNRRDALLITVETAINIEQLSLCLYMKEVPVSFLRLRVPGISTVADHSVVVIPGGGDTGDEGGTEPTDPPAEIDGRSLGEEEDAPPIDDGTGDDSAADPGTDPDADSGGEEEP